MRTVNLGKCTLFNYVNMMHKLIWLNRVDLDICMHVIMQTVKLG